MQTKSIQTKTLTKLLSFFLSVLLLFYAIPSVIFAEAADATERGSRYWKGAVEKGMRTVQDGVSALNKYQGFASVIGSVGSGLVSTVKGILGW